MRVTGIAQNVTVLTEIRPSVANTLTIKITNIAFCLGVEQAGRASGGSVLIRIQVGAFGLIADRFHGAHRLQNARDDLRRTGASRIMRICFEHFGVRQDDPKLIVQLVKQRTQFGVLPDYFVLQIQHAAGECHTPRSADAIALGPDAASGRAREASRHRVSA